MSAALPHGVVEPEVTGVVTAAPATGVAEAAEAAASGVRRAAAGLSMVSPLRAD